MSKEEELSNIEKELGVDLITFVKIFEKGIYAKTASTDTKSSVGFRKTSKS